MKQVILLTKWTFFIWMYIYLFHMMQQVEDPSKWKLEMAAEIKSLEDNNTFTETELPEGIKR